MVHIPTTVKVKVTNWETYQPRSDVKRPSWFRVDWQMIEHPEFFELTHEEFRAWIYLLAQCCKRNSATVTLNFEQADRLCGVTRLGLIGCLEKLCVSEVLTYARDGHERGRTEHVTSPAATRRDSTLRDETGRDGTGQKNLPAKVATAPITAATWLAYAQAWNRRHGGTPLRDQTVNSQLKKFVQRVGQEDAPAIAAFYVTHNDTFYVKNRHPVNLLLAQVERIRADWQAGGMITHSEATQTEKKQGIVNVWGSLIAEAEAKDVKR